MNRDKVRKAGFKFGIICRNLGATFSFVCFALLPRESADGELPFNCKFIIPCALSLALFMYGIWRTGGITCDIYD